MSTSRQVEQAIQAIQAGDRKSGQALLARALSQDPTQAEGWVWLAACLDEPEQKRYCLEQALSLRPEDPRIRQALKDLPGRQVEAANEEAGETGAEQAGPPADEGPSASRAAETAKPPGTGNTGAPPASPGAGRRKPNPQPKTGSRGALTLIWVFIGIIILASFALLLLIRAQEGAIPPTTATPPFPAQPTPAAVVPVVELPENPTRTPSMTLPPSAVRPSSTPLPTTTALPSLTPYFGYWRIPMGLSERRRPLEVVRFGSGERERLIVAGIHGGSEWQVIDLTDTFILHLRQNPDWIPDEVTLYIIRSLNPDGESLGGDPQGRFNANGVDLDRNFPEGWKSTWETEGCLTTDPEAAGPEGGSEAETKAFMEFLSERSIEALVLYQGEGAGVYPASPAEGEGSLELAQAIAAHSPYAYPPQNSGCETSGRLIDWAASQGVGQALALGLEEPGTVGLAQQLAVLDLLIHWPQSPPSRPTLTPRATDTTTPTPEATPSPAEPSSTISPIPTSPTPLATPEASASITAAIPRTPQPALTP